MECDPSSPFLPAEVLRKVQLLALNGEPNPSSRLLLLLSMCGVCHQWRQLCSEVDQETALAFDGLETAPPARGGVITRFRKTPSSKKTEVFEAAARLLTGEAGQRGRSAVWPHYQRVARERDSSGLTWRSHCLYARPLPLGPAVCETPGPGGCNAPPKALACARGILGMGA
jgi:hypothetical protein